MAGGSSDEDEDDEDEGDEELGGTDNEEGDESEIEDSQEDDDGESRKASRKPGKLVSKDGSVYKAPKLNAVTYEDAKDRKLRQKAEYERKRIGKTGLIEELKREMTADFKSNRYHGERVQQSVRAVGEKKDVKLRSHLLPPQL